MFVIIINKGGREPLTHTTSKPSSIIVKDLVFLLGLFCHIGEREQ